MIQTQNLRRRTITPSAFTLVELLVVIAIIAILAALVLPTLSRSKASARRAQCTSNHGQMILAWRMYCDDNADRVCAVGAWVAGNMTTPQDQTNAPLLVDPGQSMFARYVPTPAIYKCPGDPTANVRSVSMNCRMNNNSPYWMSGGGTNYEVFTTSQQIRVPAQIVVILDERSDTINDRSFCVDMSNTGDIMGDGASDPYWLIDYPGNYHNASGQLSFADGHVESHRWLGPDTLSPVGSAVSTQSPIDKDAQWLQDHFTYLK